MTNRHARIAIFSAQYLPSYGGVEQFTANLARELARESVDVTIVAANSQGAAACEEPQEGVMVYRLPCHPLAGGSFPTLRHGSAFDDAWARIAATHYDAVLVNTRFYTLSLRGMRLAQEQGVRCVVLDHGSAHLGFGKPSIDWAVRDYEHLITRMGLRYKADYYGISQKSAEWLRHFGITAKGSLNNAIDVGAFRAADSGRDFRAEVGIPSSEMVVAFAGRLIPGKGTGVLSDTARLMSNTDSSVQFLVAGDGPDRGALEANKPGNMHLLGRLDHSDVSALLKTSDVFFLPTKTEGFCTALLEAAAWGVPSVVTDVGGAREVIPAPQYGTVLEGTEPTAEECASRLEWYVHHREEGREQGSRCRRHVEQNYSWPATAQRVMRALGL